MNLSEVSDKILLSMCRGYDSDKDYNGSIGISLASELELRAGRTSESRERWMKNVDKHGFGNYNENSFSKKEKNLIEYVKIAQKENLIVQDSIDALNKKKNLLNKIGIYNVYVGKSPKGPIKCPVQFAREDQICSIFNKYYYKGLDFMGRYGLE